MTEDEIRLGDPSWRLLVEPRRGREPRGALPRPDLPHARWVLTLLTEDKLRPGNLS